MDEIILNNNIASPPDPVPMPPMPPETPQPQAATATPTVPEAADTTPQAEPECTGCCTDGNDPRSLCQTCRANKKQMVYDWMGDAPEQNGLSDYVEVQFKNTRKSFYINKDGLDLHKGDMVVVEGNPGYDIGEVTLTGYLVKLQMKKTNFRLDDDTAAKKVYRLVRPADMQRYYEAKAREHETMLRSRKIAEDLHLEMKIGDVEYQGDGNKAIFYYIADGRVDFRQLIKDLAAEFHVRIEMKQIGARQEAGRIGGIGPCGRELCCAGWLTKFQSVGTAAARFQDISLNPQKLAGQCVKLKCCMNFEVDCYMEAHKELPDKDITLQTVDQEYFLFKTDILARRVTYSTSKDGPFNLVTITAQRAFDIYHMNKRGQKPERLDDATPVDNRPDFTDGVGDEDLTRFDRRRRGRDRDRRRERDGGRQRSDTSAKAEPRPTPPAPPAPDAPAPQPTRGGRQQHQKQSHRQGNSAPQQHSGDPGPSPVRQPRGE